MLSALLPLVAYAVLFNSGYAYAACSDPRDPIFCSSWNGSQLGAWDMDGGAPITNSTVNSKAGNELGLNVIRYEMLRQPCTISTADTRTPGTTCTTTTQFETAINGIKAANLSADPLVVLPPIVNTDGNNQCPSGSVASQRATLEWMKWILDHATGLGVELFELGNEPNNYCTATGTQTDPPIYLGTMTEYEQYWDYYVPTLRQYARTNKFRHVWIGGPAWTSFESWDLTALEGFVTHTYNQYVSDSNNMDYVPDFVSVHTYLTSSQNTSQIAATAQINAWQSRFTDLIDHISTTWAGKSFLGYPIRDMVKVVDSEYNDTIDPSSTINNSRSWCDFYYKAMFDMANASGIWGWVQFTLAATDKGTMNLIDPVTGNEEPCFSSYANQT
jgi:hypothetical protein